jgi:hypothetical protein
MKITKANDRFLLVPGNNVEREAIAKVIELLNPGDRPNDVTTEIDKRNGRKCIKVFNIGGTKVEGDYDYVGGFNFRVRGTTLTDARYAGRIRDICFLGTGIYYVGPTLDKHSGIYLGGGPCVECGEPTVGPGAMSYSHPVCDKCAEHCPHDWKLGPYSGGDGPGLAMVCRICNRVDPDSLNLTAEEINLITAGQPVGKWHFMTNVTNDELVARIVKATESSKASQN